MESGSEVSYIDDGRGSRLNLTAALSPCDQVSDILSGAVRADGINLTLLQLPVEEIFYRFTKNFEWQVSEMSFAKALSMIAAGNAPMVLLPVFTSRMFRHSAIYVRWASNIRTPKGLERRTVGIPEWAQTAGVYVRGFLADQYGVDLSTIKWVQAGVNEPGRQEKVALQLPPGISVEVRAGKSLNMMLQTGEIDAAITARPPAAFVDGNAEVRRLFPDFRQQELAYYHATEVFPIMHLVVVRRDTFEANRWVAMNLYKAFDEARRRSVERALDITASSAPVPWCTAFAKEMSDAFGGDLWPYGIEKNRKTLEAFCHFAHTQGVTSRYVTPDELFPTEVAKTFRV